MSATKDDLLKTKSALLNQCFIHCDNRISALRNAIQEAQDAGNDETKSSSGDKYETSRAMMHLEIEKNTGLLGQANKSMQTLKSIKPNLIHSTIQLGACVHTSLGNYYLALAVGQVAIGSESYVIISPVSPVGQLLMGKKTGDLFSFRDQTHMINSVY